MFSDRDIHDSMKKFLDEMAQVFTKNDNPMLNLYSLPFKAFLELQRSTLKSYQRMEEILLHRDSAETINSFLREYMNLGLELIRFQRENSENLMKIQSDMIQMYLNRIEDTLKSFDEKKY